MKIFSPIFLSLCAVLFCQCNLSAQKTADEKQEPCTKIRTGAERTEEYLPLLKDKRVGLVVNHTSVIFTPEGDYTPLPDSLINLGVDVRCIFAPEHGYQGVADAGDHVGNSADVKTGLKIYSLYGKNKRPLAEQVKDIDVLVFDMQDVGARFYTYLSTLFYVVEACADFGKELIVLDRPNPNDTVDGPMLDKKFESFVGIVPVPLLHGCTLGEMAKMMAGERWITWDWWDESEIQSFTNEKLKVVACSGWKHGQHYDVPIAPSPNLPNPHAISLYPSLCLFEGTEVSVGRGTDFPFEVYGHPKMDGEFNFTPRPTESNKKPLQNGKLCRGEDLRDIEASKGFSLEYLLKAYAKLGSSFITSQSFFDRLAGTDILRKQIFSDLTEAEIRISWQEDLSSYKETRTKYLIYPDY